MTIEKCKQNSWRYALSSRNAEYRTLTSDKFFETKTIPVVDSTSEKCSQNLRNYAISECSASAFFPVLFTVRKRRRIDESITSFCIRKENEALNPSPRKTQSNTLYGMCICRLPKTFIQMRFWFGLISCRSSPSMMMYTVAITRIRNETNREKKNTFTRSRP